ncbi:MAG: RlmE family RNA methyltransferase [Lactobacillales bacterium]|jgi:23S rRNA (uridine2552-2'-O)-methyltransferase|nr:RlmE family RNA methyltransferase [Lactobacillales bacterium]
MKFVSRPLKTRLKKVKGRRASSTKWLQRQVNDPYVSEAKKRGYRGRAAFKLIQMDDQFHFLKPGKRVVDLGCAPGGWSQVAVERVKSTANAPLVVGLDLLEVDPVEGANLIQMDFTKDEAPLKLLQMLDGKKADVVLSDMAANTTGMHHLDHLRIMNLLELAYDFALQVLSPGGVFVAKIFQGGTENTFLAEMKKDFKSVKHVKPEASRKDSSEVYVVATGYTGVK